MGVIELRRRARLKVTKRKHELTIKSFLQKAYDAVGLAGAKVVQLEVMGTSVVGVEYDPTRLKLVLYTKEPLRRVDKKSPRQLNAMEIDCEVNKWLNRFERSRQ